MFKTRPDGMWVYLADPTYADILCIEACGSQQNLEQKRAKYAALGQSRLLRCPLEWLKEEVEIQRGSSTPRWRASSTGLAEPDEDLVLPVRHLRVLYALPADLYRKWSQNIAPAGHEYFCTYKSLGSFTSQAMQRFLRQLNVQTHFYTR